MFESSLQAVLIGDATLVSTVSTYSSPASAVPAIFSDFAPEEAVLPWIVYTIERFPSDFRGIMEFTVDIDYYSTATSHETARTASERIEFLLEYAQLTHTRFNKIRFFLDAVRIIDDPSEPQLIHVNHRFVARADRKKWMSQL